MIASILPLPPSSFEDESLLSLHSRVVSALKPLLVRAPVANAQSVGKQANVFSQRILFSHFCCRCICGSIWTRMIFLALLIQTQNCSLDKSFSAVSDDLLYIFIRPTFGDEDGLPGGDDCNNICLL